MSRTTELLKGCGRSVEFSTAKCGQMITNYEEGTYVIQQCEICKSELRGRLDALKEEVEFLYNSKFVNLEKLKDKAVRELLLEANVRLENHIASIQEEIKLIEERKE